MFDTTGANPGNVFYADTGVSEPAHQDFGAFYRFGRASTEFPKNSPVSVATTAGLNPGSCDFAVDAWVNWDSVASPRRVCPRRRPSGRWLRVFWRS